MILWQSGWSGKAMRDLRVLKVAVSTSWLLRNTLEPQLVSPVLNTGAFLSKVDYLGREFSGISYEYQFKERAFKERFDTDTYQVLIVTIKYRTGF